MSQRQPERSLQGKHLPFDREDNWRDGFCMPFGSPGSRSQYNMLCIYLPLVCFNTNNTLSLKQQVVHTSPSKNVYSMQHGSACIRQRQSWGTHVIFIRREQYS